MEELRGRVAEQVFSLLLLCGCDKTSWVLLVPSLAAFSVVSFDCFALGNRRSGDVEDLIPFDLGGNLVKKLNRVPCFVLLDGVTFFFLRDAMVTSAWVFLEKFRDQCCQQFSFHQRDNE